MRKFTAGWQHRFKLNGGTITHNRQSHPVAGVSATVTASGVLLSKRVYLTVTGPGFSWVARLDTLSMGRGQKFAAAVNAAARQAETAAAS